jgi:hypothetical protein
VVYLIEDLAVLDTEAYGKVRDEPDELTASILHTAVGFTRFIAEADVACGERSRMRHFVVAKVSNQADVTEVDRWTNQLGAFWSGRYTVRASNQDGVAALVLASFGATAPERLAPVPAGIVQVGSFDVTHWAEPSSGVRRAD